MLDLDRLIEDCRAALSESDARAAVDEVVRRAVGDPGAVVAALGEPRRVVTETLYTSAQLSIFNVLWGPGLDFYPHDHRMWAVIGVYTGREENVFYRRTVGGLARHGAKAIEPRETLALGESVIHSVANPLDRISAAIHVYGGDLAAVPRSEWDPETFDERPFDEARSLSIFEEADARLRGATRQG